MSPRTAAMQVTRTGIRIGCAHTPKANHTRSLDAHRLQTALLDPRTAVPMHPIRKLLAPIVRWL
jgi:hypothetical protein